MGEVTERAADDVLVGVLELQGDYAEHTAMLRGLGARTRGVRLPQDLDDIDALVIPGGESTTMGKLLVNLEMIDRVQQLAGAGMPMFGTCAGCIMLARELVDYPKQPRIGAMNISVRRNAFGPQIDSFEADLGGDDTDAIFHGQPLRAIHIRAPQIVGCSDDVVKLATHAGQPVLVREGNMLATTFHPEITKDTRIHAYFLDIVRQRVASLRAAEAT
mmetsp:Transcript_13984/g.37547  ORF Transcript_13984/g.37547 Transcript_13984/m.37547 type:complete len:217 (+) Transcript_13984:53-703(+)